VRKLEELKPRRPMKKSGITTRTQPQAKSSGQIEYAKVLALLSSFRAPDPVPL